MLLPRPKFLPGIKPPFGERDGNGSVPRKLRAYQPPALRLPSKSEDGPTEAEIQDLEEEAFARATKVVGRVDHQARKVQRVFTVRRADVKDVSRRIRKSFTPEMRQISTLAQDLDPTQGTQGPILLQVRAIVNCLLSHVFGLFAWTLPVLLCSVTGTTWFYPPSRN